MPQDHAVPRSLNRKMPSNDIPIRGNTFSRIKEARQALREKALDFLALYEENAKVAMAAGDHEVVMKSMQWILEHLPQDEDGTLMIDPSIDRPVPQNAMPAGPQINLGIAIGGVTRTAGELPPMAPADIIDVDPDGQ